MAYSTSTNRSLFRSRHGIIFGVCRGLADYADISVLWVRAGAVVGLVLTGFWPMFLIYLVAAIFLRPAPVIEFASSDDWAFYQNYVTDRRQTLRQLKERCDQLDRRTRRMEDRVTDREYDWNRRFQEG